MAAPVDRNRESLLDELRDVHRQLPTHALTSSELTVLLSAAYVVLDRVVTREEVVERLPGLRLVK